jgi:hypothetical protein
MYLSIVWAVLFFCFPFKFIPKKPSVSFFHHIYFLFIIGSPEIIISEYLQVFFNSLNLSDRSKGNYHEIMVNYFTFVFKKYTQRNNYPVNIIKKKNLSRRRFIHTSLFVIAGLSVLPLIKGCAKPVSDTIRIGVIGLGRQSVFLTNGFNQINGLKIVAGSDVYDIKRQRFEINVKKQYEKLEQVSEVTTYENYQDILARKDIDAVIISTPDHWHAIQGLRVKTG